MVEFFKKNFLLLLGFFVVIIFFNKVFLLGLLPIPTDNIVGLYHPYRDFYSEIFPRGIPFENMQVTDPVRQQYPWKELAVDVMKEFELPLWNPYVFAGYPLLANFQSAVFFPGNILLFVFPFEIGWSILVVLQPLLAFTFMLFYLRNLKVSNMGAFIGSFAFAFSGFFVSWLEWGTVVMTGLWLPLILLSIDKIMGARQHLLTVKNIWGLIFLFSLVSAFFAGHLQVFFYLSIVSLSYFIMRWVGYDKKISALIHFIILTFLFTIITAVQWIPTLEFIKLSARSIDQSQDVIIGWYLPWQNLVQFIVPDFFGNPATLNYWGVWNYGEFIGYVGILPLILALGYLLFKRDRISLFFGAVLIISLIFALPTIFAKIPFKFEIPFIATSQPTRLVYLIDFALAVLAAFGFDYFVKNKKKILYPTFFVGAFLLVAWIMVLVNQSLPATFGIESENLATSFNNLKLPTITFFASFILIVIFIVSNKKIKKVNISRLILLALVLLFVFDIGRFADKYTVFSKKEYLYPNTAAIDFLKGQQGKFRIMAADSRILPPNFTTAHRIESVDGYDPLFTMRYAEFIAAAGRNDPNIDPPFGFNRIITPQNYHSRLIDILNVKYLLTLGEIQKEGFKKVFEEGETLIYENENFIERAFFVSRTMAAKDKRDSIGKIFENQNSLNDVAIVENENSQNFNREWSSGKVEIVSYRANEVTIMTENDEEGFLVLTDSYYPSWSATVDGASTEIILTNYNFRGVIVPAGSREVIFTNSIF